MIRGSLGKRNRHDQRQTQKCTYRLRKSSMEQTEQNILCSCHNSVPSVDCGISPRSSSGAASDVYCMLMLSNNIKSISIIKENAIPKMNISADSQILQKTTTSNNTTVYLFSCVDYFPEEISIRSYLMVFSLFF